MTEVRILIVEDQIDVAETIRNALELLGYVVPAVALYGEEAIQLAGEIRPDLVLMDIELPGRMDGIEVAAEIRTRCDIPVVYLTAHAGDQTLRRARVTEPFGYILKPFKTGELHSVIEMALYKHKMEKRLKESEERYRLLVEHSGNAITLFDRDGTVLLMNVTGAANLGGTPDDFVGKSMYELFPGRADELMDRVRQIIESGVGSDFEDVLELPAGRQWFESSIQPIKDSSGKTFAVQIISQNITGRKRMEEALHIQRNLAIALSSTSDLAKALNQVLEATFQIEGIDCGGLYLVDGLTGGLDLVSHRGLSLQFTEHTSHYDADAPSTRLVMAGKPVYSRHSEVVDIMDPVRQREGLRALAVLPVWHEDVDGRSTVIAALNLASHTHDEIPTSARHAIEAIAAQIGGVIARIRTEEALRESKKRFKGISETISDFAYSIHLEPDGTPVHEWVTEAFTRITGFTPEETDARGGWQSIVYPDDMPIYRRRMQAFLSGQPQFDEYRIITRSGEVRWLGMHTRPIWDETQDRIVRIIGAAQDITERKRAEEQIKAALEENQVLLQEIHHRVKNNLQIISSLLDLQSNYIQDERALKTFEDGRNRILSMALVHEQLYQSTDLARVDFAAYVQTLAEHLFRSYNIDSDAITLKIAVDDVSLELDSAISCGLIINELISNALKHAFPGGRKGQVHVVFCEEEGGLVLTVSDDGVGIPEDLDWRDTESLGLPLVSTLTEQLGGTIELDREDGTVFTITLPAQSAAGQPQEP